MMSVIDVTADAPAHGTPRHHVRQVMLVPREPRDADRGRHAVSRDLHRRMALVLVRDHGGDGPRLRRVTRRKRTAAFEELAAIDTIDWSFASRDPLQRAFDDSAVDKRLEA